MGVRWALRALASFRFPTVLPQYYILYNHHHRISLYTAMSDKEVLLSMGFDAARVDCMYLYLDFADYATDPYPVYQGP